MDTYIFPGYPVFQRQAADAMKLDTSLAEGRALPPLAAVANLCAQASHAEPSAVDAILREASVYRDRLLIAARASELMIGEVASRLRDEVRPADRPNDRGGESRTTVDLPRSSRLPKPRS